jgi:hypothetical protein
MAKNAPLSKEGASVSPFGIMAPYLKRMRRASVNSNIVRMTPTPLFGKRRLENFGRQYTRNISRVNQLTLRGLGVISRFGAAPENKIHTNYSMRVDAIGYVQENRFRAENAEFGTQIAEWPYTKVAFRVVQVQKSPKTVT